MKLSPIYKQTKGGKIQQWEIEVVGNQYRTISGQTDGKSVISEWTTVYGKNVGRSNETTDEEQAMKEAEAKRTLKLERGYFENIGDIQSKQYFEPMLATKWEDRKDKVAYPIYSQPKLDGIRCIVSSEGMFSRNGKPILSAPHIFDSLRPLFRKYPSLIFDGELYADKFANDFNKIVSLVKKTKPTTEDLKESESVIEYHIYDLPSFSANFGHRMVELDILFNTNDTSVQYCKLVDTHIANNENSVMELYERYVDGGYEGQMLRLDNPYENKRSNTLMKHKSFVDEEFTILDIVEGEGNRSGTAGFMRFRTADGKDFKSSVKGTLAETAEILRNKDQLIGKEATVKYFNLTPDGIPRFPYVINIDRNNYE
jgi:ATP-dependent DNA ligase